MLVTVVTKAHNCPSPDPDKSSPCNHDLIFEVPY